jgi:hypothetical protein
MQPVLNFEQASNKLKETEGFFQMELPVLFRLFVQYRTGIQTEQPEFANRYLQEFDAFIKGALNDISTAC